MFNNLVGALVSGGKGYIGGVNQAKEEQDVARRRAREEEEFTWLQEDQTSKRKLRPMLEETAKRNFDIANKNQADKELLDSVFPFVMSGEFDHASELMFSRDPTRFPRFQTKLDPSTNLYSVSSGGKILGNNMQREQVQNLFFLAMNPGKQDVPKLAGDATGGGGSGSKEPEFWNVALNTAKAKKEAIDKKREAATARLDALRAQREGEKKYNPDNRTQEQIYADNEMLNLQKLLGELEDEETTLSNWLTFLFVQTGGRGIDDPDLANALDFTLKPRGTPGDTKKTANEALAGLQDGRALPTPEAAMNRKVEISSFLRPYLDKLLKSGNFDSVYDTALAKVKSKSQLNPEEQAALVYMAITNKQVKEAEAKEKEAARRRRVKQS